MIGSGPDLVKYPQTHGERWTNWTTGVDQYTYPPKGYIEFVGCLLVERGSSISEMDHQQALTPFD
jgi:hypothetical protein